MYKKREAEKRRKLLKDLLQRAGELQSQEVDQTLPSDYGDEMEAQEYGEEEAIPGVKG